ncbi:MAG: hypothetical protein AAGG38_11980 [Planctomycetota bacterium]
MPPTPLPPAARRARSRARSRSEGAIRPPRRRGLIHGLALGLLAAVPLAAGCTKAIPQPDLGDRYNRSAQYHGPERNPVIVIPGILGSKLVDNDTGQRVWGAFDREAADPGTAAGARLIGLPMAQGTPLYQLTDNVGADGALDSVRLSLFGLPIQVDAYAQILGTLGVGGYLDNQLAEAGAIDYGTDHYTCFQFDYDWRRDNVENAQRLYAFIEEQRVTVQENLAEDFGGEPGDYDVKFDIVAHSMGGLLTRYMLRYGDADLAPAGEAPRVTWAGAEHVDRVILVATPSAGSVDALIQLVKGTKFLPILSAYDAATLGTMPSIYQLLPRERHRRVVYEASAESGRPGGQPVDLYNPETWDTFEWGLADPDQDRVLRRLLPGLETAAQRRAVARDHLAKCLERAERFHAALDVPARRPDNLYLALYAGDAIPTHDRAIVEPRGRIARLTRTPGDGTVTRASAMMDERVGGQWSPFMPSPIEWSDINLLFVNHLGLTASPIFADNVLYLLLESPKREASPAVDTHTPAAGAS